jgi:hypothetical protein
MQEFLIVIVASSKENKNTIRFDSILTIST